MAQISFFEMAANATVFGGWYAAVPGQFRIGAASAALRGGFSTGPAQSGSVVVGAHRVDLVPAAGNTPLYIMRWSVTPSRAGTVFLAAHWLENIVLLPAGAFGGAGQSFAPPGPGTQVVAAKDGRLLAFAAPRDPLFALADAELKPALRVDADAATLAAFEREPAAALARFHVDATARGHRLVAARGR